MVVQPVTAPGNAPENPRFDLNIEIVHLPGQMPYAENKTVRRGETQSQIPSVCATGGLTQKQSLRGLLLRHLLRKDREVGGCHPVYRVIFLWRQDGF